MAALKKWIIFCLAMLFVVPFVYLSFLSIAKGWIFPYIFPTHIEMKNWERIFRWNDGLLTGLFNSLFIAMIVGASSTALGFVVSRAMNMNFQSNLILFLCYLPFIISPVIYAVLLNYFFLRMDLTGTELGIIIAQLIIALPFSLILFRTFWSERLNLIEQISYTLGSSASQTFTRVLLPLAKPMLVVCFFQTFLISWFEFGLTSFIGLGKVETLTIKVYQYIGEANLPYAAISCILIVLPPAVLLWINRKFVFTKFK